MPVLRSKRHQERKERTWSNESKYQDVNHQLGVRWIWHWIGCMREEDGLVSIERLIQLDRLRDSLKTWVGSIGDPFHPFLLSHHWLCICGLAPTPVTKLKRLWRLWYHGTCQMVMKPFHNEMQTVCRQGTVAVWVQNNSNIAIPKRTTKHELRDILTARWSPTPWFVLDCIRGVLVGLFTQMEWHATSSTTTFVKLRDQARLGPKRRCSCGQQ